MEIFQKFFVHKTEHLGIQFVRYIFAAGIGYIADFGSLFILTEYFNIHYLISAIFAFLLGLSINYALSIKWVFNLHRLSSRWAEFSAFGLIGVVGLGINELFLWVFTEFASYHYLVSKLIATVFVLVWNFLTRRYILFSRKDAAA